MDCSTKRAKVDQETEKVNVESNGAEGRATILEQHVPSTSVENGATSTLSSMANPESKAEDIGEKSGYDQLPKEMHEMRIRDEKGNSHDEKVNLHECSFSTVSNFFMFAVLMFSTICRKSKLRISIQFFNLLHKEV